MAQICSMWMIQIWIISPAVTAYHHGKKRRLLTITLDYRHQKNRVIFWGRTAGFLRHNHTRPSHRGPQSAGKPDPPLACWGFFLRGASGDAVTSQEFERLAPSPEEWSAYQFRDSFNLFELACLLNRKDPEMVSNDAVAAIRHDRSDPDSLDLLLSGHELASAIMLRPETYLSHPVGKTLAMLRKAAGTHGWAKTPRDKAQQLAKAVGLAWPPELERKGATAERPVQTGRAQEVAILDAIKAFGLDPLSLPKNSPGRPGIKRRIRGELQGSPLFKNREKAFDKAWERLRSDGEVGDQ